MWAYYIWGQYWEAKDGSRLTAAMEKAANLNKSLRLPHGNGTAEIHRGRVRGVVGRAWKWYVVCMRNIFFEELLEHDGEHVAKSIR